MIIGDAPSRAPDKAKVSEERKLEQERRLRKGTKNVPGSKEEEDRPRDDTDCPKLLRSNHNKRRGVASMQDNPNDKIPPYSKLELKLITDLHMKTIQVEGPRPKVRSKAKCLS